MPQAWLRAPRFEVLPLPGTAERTTELPAGATVTVTASPRHGIDATVTLVETLADAGFDAVPHLAARQIRDRSHLATILGRLERAGVRDVFVVGGDTGTTDNTADTADTDGPFADGLALLEAIEQYRDGGRFDRIGVPAYPEGHPLIDDDALWRALDAKQHHATYAVTQMCFDGAAIARFIGSARDRGIALPFLVGIPGVVATPKLLRTGLRIGVGASVGFVRGHRSMGRRLLTPGRYRPDALLRRLAEHLPADDGGPAQVAGHVAGLHIYTFNQTAATARWWRQRVSKPEGFADDHAV